LKTKADLTEGAILPHLLKMALPMMIGMTAHMAQNIIDGIYVGRLGLEESMAVLNYGFPFFYFIFAVLNGLVTGSNSVLARLIGAKKREEAENALGQLAWISMGILALALMATPLLLPLYLKAQGASARGAALTWDYLLPLALGLPLTVLALNWGAGLRAEGDTRTLMNGMMLGVIVNMVGAPFLIYREFRFLGIEWQGLDWGVAGAGWATVASGFAMAGLIGSHYLRGKTLLRFRWFPQWKDNKAIRDAFRVGFPSILSQSLISVNLAVITWCASHLGPQATAAVGIGLRLDILSIFPSLSVMVAVLSLVGQNYGARRYDRVRESVKRGLVLSGSILLGLGVMVHFGRPGVVGWFDADPQTTQSAMDFMFYLTLAYPFVGMGIVASGAFQGLGRGLPFLTLTTLRLVILTGPLAYFLSRWYGETGLHIAPMAASVITGIGGVIWILYTVSKLPRESLDQENPQPSVVSQPS
jgi:putative MATE family efflux protein